MARMHYLPHTLEDIAANDHDQCRQLSFLCLLPD